MHIQKIGQTWSVLVTFNHPFSFRQYQILITHPNKATAIAQAFKGITELTQ